MTYVGISTSGTMTQTHRLALLEMMQVENTKDIKDSMRSIDSVINRVKNRERWIADDVLWSQKMKTRQLESAIKRLGASLEEAKAYLQAETSAFANWELES